jgi:hypothetical protein
VGLFAGAAAGATSCLLVEQSAIFWAATLAAAMAGFVVGGFIGARQMRNPKKAASPDIATFIFVVYSLIPACAILLGGLGFAVGKFPAYLILGMAFGMPMVASLIGAVLDRIYESYLRRSG